LRVGAVGDQMPHAMGERVGFPRTRARDDEERRSGAEGLCADAVLHGLPLGRAIHYTSRGKTSCRHTQRPPEAIRKTDVCVRIKPQFT